MLLRQYHLHRFRRLFRRCRHLLLPVHIRLFRRHRRPLQLLREQKRL
jgi:hypothetical protein